MIFSYAAAWVQLVFWMALAAVERAWLVLVLL
jgi:hypothetical protein